MEIYTVSFFGHRQIAAWSTVEHSKGGAYQTMQYARKASKAAIINLFQEKG